MSPEDIEAMFGAGGNTAHAESDDDDEDIVLSPEEQRQRTAQLRECLLTAQQLWSSGDPALDEIAEKLADGSRDESWRPFVGDSGVLDFFLGVNSVQHLRQSLRIHVLRLIGNSCADTDENRSRVLAANSLPSIVRLLADDSLLAFVIPVLYNICVDYEPAQLSACRSGLSSALVGLISGPRLRHCQAFINIICKLLSLMATQEHEISTADPSTPIHLLNLATNPSVPIDLDDFCALASVALTYLATPRFQQALLLAPPPHHHHRGSAFPTLLSAFSLSYANFDADQADPDDAAQLRQVRTAFVQAVADVSALPEFADACPLGASTPAVQTLRGWLASGYGHAGLETAACLALGNLARSDASSTALVRDLRVHAPLVALLSRPYPKGRTTPVPASQPPAAAGPDAALPPPQLLHALLSFLKNLAIPAQNKAVLGAQLLASSASGPPLLPRLWSSALDAQPQTQFAAVSLARLLLVGCAPNVAALCAPLSHDVDSPARARSNLHVLSALYSRADAEPTKTEAARAVAAVCRVLHSCPASSQTTDPPILADWAPPLPTTTTAADAAANSDEADDPAEASLAAFYAAHAPDLTRLLGHLATSARFPALRSEAWFVLALMARSSAAGAKLAVHVLAPLDVCRALVEAVTGRDMLDGRRLQELEQLEGGGEGQGGAAGLTASNSNSNNDTQGAPVAAIVSDTSRLAQDLAGLSGGGGGGDQADEKQAVDPAQAANMAKADRENGLVLVACMLRGDQVQYLPPTRYTVFQEMLKTGGEMVLHARNEERTA